MKHHWDFFKESDNSFGLFYPIHYTVAAFEHDTRAELARRRLMDAGFADDDLAIASGSFMVRTLESVKGANWLDRWRIRLAQLVGTEAGFIEDDLKLARRGAAFLFVYTPDRDSIDRIHALMHREHPMVARRYHQAGIESICAPAQQSTL